LQAVNIRPFSKTDWVYTAAGLLAVFVATGVIFGVSSFLNKNFGLPMLSTTPWFMEMHPFQGRDRLLLLVWLPMFFFNITGEEILWRGYIQNRLRGIYSWLLCSILWMLFHLPFGIDLQIMLIPLFIVVPYVFHKTQNTRVGILIHGIYNGPIFIAVALGTLK
jgi:membrane protease YdiL (CAAX protease family)